MTITTTRVRGRGIRHRWEAKLQLPLPAWRDPRVTSYRTWIVQHGVTRFTAKRRLARLQRGK